MASVGAPDLPGRVAKVDRARWIEILGRVGLVAKGLSYALVGYLALRLAFGAGGGATSRQGALATIATHGWGKALLIALALGNGLEPAEAAAVGAECGAACMTRRGPYGAHGGPL